MKYSQRLSAWFTGRYQLTIRNQADWAERATFSLSPAKLLALGTILLLIFITCSLALSTTLLTKWLNPAHLETENKKKICQLTTSVDELEAQIVQQQKFITLLQSIIAGKSPPTYPLPPAADVPPEQEAPPCPAPHLAAADARLRHELENEKDALWTVEDKLPKAPCAQHFFPPVQGTIATPFSHHPEHHGIGLTVPPKAPVKCIAPGTVIFAAWTGAEGWVMGIQHANAWVSIYKRNAALFRKVGSFVAGGEVVAVASQAQPWHFALWHAGRPVDPVRFIAF